MTSVGGMLGILNIKAMQNAHIDEVWVLGVDAKHNDNANYYCDKFLKVPSGNSNSYIKEIIKIIKKYNINKILPCSDEEAIVLAKNKNMIERLGVQLFVTEYSSIKIMSNKLKTYSLLKNNNILVPEYKEINSFCELDFYTEEYFKQYGSFVIKEPTARGNRGTILVDKLITGKIDYNGSRELHIGWDYYRKVMRARIDKNFPKIITERLFAPAYDIDVLAKEGNIIHSIPRERINPAGVPYKGNIIRDNKNLIDISRQVVKALNLSWLYDLDIMTRKDGSHIVLEINPRPSGSCVASIISGIPLYKDLLELFDKDKFNTPQKIKDGLVISPYTDCSMIIPK